MFPPELVAFADMFADFPVFILLGIAVYTSWKVRGALDDLKNDLDEIRDLQVRVGGFEKRMLFLEMHVLSQEDRDRIKSSILDRLKELDTLKGKENEF